MIQRHISHAKGRFSKCRECGQEPRHIRSVGRKADEPGILSGRTLRHSLECRCGARTQLHESIAEAEAEWGTDYAQLGLPLIQRRRRRKVAA